jgi:hypothetical protein
MSRLRSRRIRRFLKVVLGSLLLIICVVGINHPGYSAITFLKNRSFVKFNTSSRSERDAIAQQSSNLSAVVDSLLKMNSLKESML